MTETKLFIKDGYYCIVEKDDDESYEHFNERGNFIVSQKSKNIIEIKKINTYSKIWINYKFLGCEYNKEIMNKLNNYQKNLFTTI
jgi:hypothetical protein